MTDYLGEDKSSACMGEGGVWPRASTNGRPWQGVRAGQLESLRSSFLSQRGHDSWQQLPWERVEAPPEGNTGWDKGVPGRVSCWVGNLCGCGPGARPGSDFASSLAQARITLSPIP